jgi:hypothetical protein
MGFMQKKTLQLSYIKDGVPPVLKQHYVKFLLKGNKATGLDGKNLICIDFIGKPTLRA